MKALITGASSGIGKDMARYLSSLGYDQVIGSVQYLQLGEKYVSFDLGMLSKYHYYTGVIFEAVMVVGNTSVGSIAGGGRYDNLLRKMNKGNLQAIGFAVNFYELDRFLKEKSNSGGIGTIAVKYSEKAELKKVYEIIEKYISEGKKVIFENDISENTEYEKFIEIDEKGEVSVK